MNIVADARSAAGLTQSELARRVGVSQPAIARLESAGANPRLRTLDRVVRACGRRLEVVPAVASSIDETLVVERLRMSPGERLLAFERNHANVAEIRLARN